MADKKKTDKTPPGVKLLSDGRYFVSAKITDPRTKEPIYKQQTLPKGTTLGGAIDARAAMIAQAKGELAPSRKEAPPILSAYAKSWLARRVVRVRAPTARLYVGLLEGFILPQLGALRVDEINRADVEGFAAWLEGSKYAHNTRKTAWAVCLMILRDACADLGLPDPSQRVAAPRGHSKPAGRALSSQELGRFVEAALGCGIERAALVSLLAYSGLRRSEASLQRREDLSLANLDDAWLRVTHSKTDAGARRLVPLPRAVAELLERHLATAPASPWLFPCPDNHANPKSTHWVGSVIRSVCARSGIDCTPHDLRRTFITLAVKQGAERLVLRSLVGHAQQATTDHYFRTSLEDRRNALKLVEAEVGRGLGVKVGG